MILEILNFAKPETSGFLVDIVYWLVNITSSVALGIILFTVILKLITLPFDYISRASMRKNNIIMEEMRPELEKLQRQYADNKELYNQKMMALYKKNGYSIFGSCLPTILTLVIFIVAISAFTKYSQFQNKEYFYNMNNAYNNVVYEGFTTDDEFIYYNEDGNFVIDMKAIKANLDETGKNYIDLKDAEGKDYKILVNTENSGMETYYSVKTTDGYSEYIKYDSGNGEWTGKEEYKLSLGSKFYELSNAEGKTFNQLKEENPELTEIQFITEIRQEKSAETYRSYKKKFLWVKNVWVKDSTGEKSIELDWESFKSEHGYEEDTGTFDSDDYNQLIAKLDVEKEQPNGYFILAILTAGISFLTQWVLGKTQKAQMELQTVDGQGASTQKMMMWMMPIMMAVFAFMYTAAFSIYIILSSLLGLATTLGINFIVDRKYKKKQTSKPKQVVRGRVYTPKEEPKKEEPKKKQKEQPKNDFLSGLADKKKKK